MNTLSVDQVKEIHAKEAARKDPPMGFDARQSTRVLVKAKLQELNPVPYGPDSVNRFTGPLSRVEHAAHVARMRAAVTEEDHAAFARAKGSKDAIGVLDAHHFAQKMHQKGLWAEADRLVDEVLSEEKGAAR